MTFNYSFRKEIREWFLLRITLISSKKCAVSPSMIGCNIWPLRFVDGDPCNNRHINDLHFKYSKCSIKLHFTMGQIVNFIFKILTICFEFFRSSLVNFFFLLICYFLVMYTQKWKINLCLDKTKSSFRKFFKILNHRRKCDII